MPEQPDTSDWGACVCGDCDGGCDNIGMNATDDGPICDECEMGMHWQDRDDESEADHA